MCPATGSPCMAICMNGCRAAVPGPLCDRDPRVSGGPIQQQRFVAHDRAENEQLRAKVARIETELATYASEAKRAQAEAVRRAVASLLSQRAELRGDVMALWQRLGDLLAVFDSKAHLSAEQQDKLRNARALHALWSETPDPTNGG